MQPEQPSDRSFQQVMTYERTPGQTWNFWGDGLIRTAFFILIVATAMRVYILLKYSYWNLPDAGSWVVDGHSYESYSTAEDIAAISELFYGVSIVGFLIAGACKLRGYHLRKKELAAERTQIRTDAQMERDWLAHYSEVVQGFGPLAMQRHLYTLQMESGNLEKILQNEIELKQIEATMVQGAAKQRVADEMTLMRGMIQQIKELNKIKATDPILGQQVWAQWQQTKPTSRDSI